MRVTDLPLRVESIALAAVQSQSQTHKAINCRDEYIAKFPKDIRDVEEVLRRVVKESAPKAEETTSYGMPALKLNVKSLVYFAAHENHVGFYPTSSPIEAIKKELTPYKHSKGTVQFPLDKPIPFDLVKKMVKFRAKETESKKSRT